MGREIRILCDFCGADCTDDHFTLDVWHRAEGQSRNLTLQGDFLYLCRYCFQQFCLNLVDRAISLGAEWEETDEEDLV